jgi:hypothetical protein
LCVEFGDIWKTQGCVALQVNEYFDSLLGNHVSTNSLHGQFIRDVMKGRSDEFDRLVSAALTGQPFVQVQRPSGNTRRFKIGTTAAVDIGPTRYLLYAFATTDISTLKASATVHELWDALAGGGLSGVGLPARILLEILLTSFAYYTKKQKITGKLTIVIPKHLSAEIDLRQLRF